MANRFIARSSLSSGTVLLELNLQGGVIPHLGPSNAHAGGGYVSDLGGVVTGTAGNGTNNPNTHHNQIITNETAAQGSKPGNTYAIKTFYAAGEQEPGIGHSNSFAKNTTVIRIPEVNSGWLHVRWSQKWSAVWEWPSGHQKMLKVRNSRASQVPSHNMGKIQVDSENAGLMPACAVVSIGGTTPTGFRQVYSNLYNWVPTDSSNIEDQLENEIGGPGTDLNFIPQVDTWYDMEIGLKFDSTPGAKDAEQKLWVNDDLYIHYTGADQRPAGDETGVDMLELQHVRETAEVLLVDMPTYYDNLKIVHFTTETRIGRP